MDRRKENCRKELEWYLSLLEGMLIETGGTFAQHGLKNYFSKCVSQMEEYYQQYGDKTELQGILDSYFEQYETATSWKYYDIYIGFLNDLKVKLQQL